MPFPRIYADEACPLDGYEGYVFRVLLNPTGAEKEAWFNGMGNRDTLAPAAVAVFGTSKVEGFDFSTAEGALNTLKDDAIPDELWAWLFLLPGTRWADRLDEVKKKLQKPSPTGN